MHALFRKSISIQQKPSTYISNGDGRDSYIHLNNGGNIKATEQRSYINRTQLKGGKLMTKPDRQQIPKSIHYFSDGSGKDSYIISNNGGFSQTISSPNNPKFFISTLRSYEQTRAFESYNRRDYFMESQYKGTKRQQAIKNSNYKRQTDSCERLSSRSPSQKKILSTNSNQFTTSEYRNSTTFPKLNQSTQSYQYQTNPSPYFSEYNSRYQNNIPNQRIQTQKLKYYNLKRK